MSSSNEQSSTQKNKDTKNKSWLEKITQIFTGEPKTKEDLIEVLREGANKEIVNHHSLNMMEGVLEVHELRVRDVMIPRSQMVIVKNDMDLQAIIDTVSNSGHSRFPVIAENKDEVVGILLAKDLLNYAFNNEKFSLNNILRSAEFIPEGKRLDTLLQDFRKKRNHIAIVVDEYGGVTGLITIEDVIEQITGDIEDEHDAIEAPLIKKRVDGSFNIKALTELEEFNEYFHADLEDQSVETIGGLLLKKFGRLPEKNETIEIDKFLFKILRSDSRRILSIQVKIKK